MSLEYARNVMIAESKAIQMVCDRLDSQFEQGLDILADCKGRVVACGMGKAGIIAQKIAATLSSTGSPAFTLHPADALHGDLGMVSEGDVALILSNSGESEEVIRLLPCLRRAEARIIAITASPRSTLAAQADVVLLLGDLEEACPLGLAPTATTTAMLALGDALALCLMKRRGFKMADYASLHPAGALGRKTMPIEDLMRVGDSVAAVEAEATVSETILAITSARAGAAVVVDDQRKVLGVFCDGDLRRGLEIDSDILLRPVAAVMTSPCRTVRTGMRADDVLQLMKENRIAEIPVVSSDNVLAGMADLKGILASL